MWFKRSVILAISSNTTIFNAVAFLTTDFAFENTVAALRSVGIARPLSVPFRQKKVSFSGRDQKCLHGCHRHRLTTFDALATYATLFYPLSRMGR